MQRWFAVHTKAALEAKAVAEIRNQGFRAENPLCSYQRKRSRRVETIVRPLFPRYVFAAFDLADDEWRPLYHTKGVVRILDFQNIPQPIRAGVIEEILEQASSAGGVIPLKKPEFKPFVKGEKVKVVQGPYTSFDALIELDEGERVKVLLDLFGRSHVIPMTRESIARG